MENFSQEGDSFLILMPEDSDWVEIMITVISTSSEWELGYEVRSKS